MTDKQRLDRLSIAVALLVPAVVFLLFQAALEWLL